MESWNGGVLGGAISRAAIDMGPVIKIIKAARQNSAGK